MALLCNSWIIHHFCNVLESVCDAFFLCPTVCGYFVLSVILVLSLCDLCYAYNCCSSLAVLTTLGRVCENRNKASYRTIPGSLFYRGFIWRHCL